MHCKLRDKWSNYSSGEGAKSKTSRVTWWGCLMSAPQHLSLVLTLRLSFFIVYEKIFWGLKRKNVDYTAYLKPYFIFKVQFFTDIIEYSSRPAVMKKKIHFLFSQVSWPMKIIEHLEASVQSRKENRNHEHWSYEDRLSVQYTQQNI